jgi:hypothetical protein
MTENNSENNTFPFRYFIATVGLYVLASIFSIVTLYLICQYACQIFQQVYYIILILPLIIVGYIVIKLGAKASLEYKQKGLTAKFAGIAAFITFLLLVGTFQIEKPNCCNNNGGVIPPPSPRPFPEVVKAKCDKIHKILSDKELRKKLTCNQYTEGNNLILEFKGVKDFYELGEYDFSRNQHVKVLADLIGEIYKDFDIFRSSEPSFYVDLLISDSADGNQMTEKKPYTGSQELACECYKKGTSQSQIEQLVPNKEQVDGYLLGCARAGYFADYLLTQKQLKLNHLKLIGREFEEKGGEYRNIKVIITFNNLLKLGNITECKVCEK